MRIFVSDKCQSCGDSNIILWEVDVLITDPAYVAGAFNTYNASIAESESITDVLDSRTLDDCIQKHKDHKKYSLDS